VLLNGLRDHQRVQNSQAGCDRNHLREHQDAGWYEDYEDCLVQTARTMFAVSLVPKIAFSDGEVPLASPS
jgi:hypothetical protein